jgi:glutamine cyclotransferase
MLLLFAIGCKNETVDEQKPQNDKPVELTPVIPYQVINEFPHDTSAFTEGLEYHNGYIYEGTGEYGSSDIRKTELKTGKALLTHKLDSHYFGEGITIIGNKIYQLTYKEHTGFVYDLSTFKQLNTFKFSAAEGWGMTHDSVHLIYSDGTSTLYFLNPETFKEEKTIVVKDNFGSVSNINELEYINGYIYANIWQTAYIIKIDPTTGRVLGQADLSTLRQRAGIPATADVMNGIAYDKAGNRIFITGKYWPKLFEIRLDN